LTATTGSVLDQNAAEGVNPPEDIFAPNGRVIVRACAGLAASADFVEMDAETVEFDAGLTAPCVNSDLAGIFVTETNQVTIIRAYANFNGDIEITAGNTMTVLADRDGVLANGSGSITLLSIAVPGYDEAAAQDINIQDMVKTIAGSIVIRAQDNVNQENTGADVTVQTGVGTIIITAEDGAFFMFESTNVSADLGEIRAEAETDITIGSITTNHDDTVNTGTYTQSIGRPAVTLLANTGDIKDSAGGNDDIDIVAAAGRIVARAPEGSFGEEVDCNQKNTYIRTTIYQLDILTKTSIYMEETDDLLVVRLDVTDGSQVSLNNNGSLRFVSVTPISFESFDL